MRSQDHATPVGAAARDHSLAPRESVQPCDCIDAVNAGLAQHNAQILLPWIGPQRPFVQTHKLDDKKRGKIPSMFASFCPFCGAAYPKERGD